MLETDRSGSVAPARSVAQYARTTSGGRWTSAGVPSAIFTPWSSATMRPARRDAIRRSCSTSSTVIPSRPRSSWTQ